MRESLDAQEKARKHPAFIILRQMTKTEAERFRMIPGRFEEIPAERFQAGPLTKIHVSSLP